MEGTLEELRRISNCPEGATFSQLGLRKSVDSSKRSASICTWLTTRLFHRKVAYWEPKDGDASRNNPTLVPFFLNSSRRETKRHRAMIPPILWATKMIWRRLKS